MVASPVVLAVVVNRLLQDPADWKRFEWRQLAGRTSANQQRTPA
jgi:hypothetical protein